MTPNRRRLFLSSLFAVGLLAACARTAPVQEGGGNFSGRGTLAQRADQIRRAGTGLGWIIEPQGPGLMRGTLNLRTHQAVVDIPYDTQRFSIRYVSSSNLDYDGTVIHRNYNSWVQNLQNAIMVQSSAS
ncbi:hypothetical protein [Siccirubricoccus phaeus]|uniref:hypothetical protein n=1 Tax=Siccirubricoccus phaeus TaxID=2595053 RepID=UPI0011F339C3|nr:hypothetical protein [Siccirubricoccus phaeus]